MRETPRSIEYVLKVSDSVNSSKQKLLVVALTRRNGGLYLCGVSFLPAFVAKRAQAVHPNIPAKYMQNFTLAIANKGSRAVTFGDGRGDFEDDE